MAQDTSLLDRIRRAHAEKAAIGIIMQSGTTFNGIPQEVGEKHVTLDLNLGEGEDLGDEFAFVTLEAHMIEAVLFD